MKYLKILDDGFKEECLNNPKQDEYPLDKIEYIAERIFDFYTYENEIQSLLCKKALEICEAITERKTHEYVSTDEGRYWYHILTQMPFFQDKTEWGCSIRGAWWDHSVDFFVVDVDLIIPRDDWDEFILDLIEFSKGGCEG